MSQSINITEFRIYKLFGTRDVIIPFDDNVKIIIGENGMGKTQVLNIIYYTLSGKLERLADFAFEAVKVVFSDDSEVNLRRGDTETESNIPVVNRVTKLIGSTKFEELINEFHFFSGNTEQMSTSRIFREVIHRYPITTRDLIRALQIESLKKDKSIQLGSLFSTNEKLKKLKTFIGKNEILYFPTYRRVEEDLKNLGLDEETFDIDKEDSRLINFGMQDVKKRFNRITKKIERKSREGLSKFTGELLSQLVKGLPQVDKSFLDEIDEDDIEIILARVGNEITADDKVRIKQIVATREFEAKDQTVLFFLQKLIAIYDEQRDLDELIKKFRDVCNRYLFNKQIIYDESTIELSIQTTDSKESLVLNLLSSGEKQILSIFSRIYLSEGDTRFFVLFDEPELSLSIDWQKMLLPDIYNSGKCQFLFAVTHSPFIFDNELDKHAIGLNMFFANQNGVTA